MADTKRVIIGSEVNDDRKIELDSLGSKITVPVSFYDENGNLVNSSGFNITKYDYIALTYSGSNITQVVYKRGGSSGTIVGTLTLEYSGSNLVSVTKS